MTNGECADKLPITSRGRQIGRELMEVSLQKRWRQWLLTAALSDLVTREMEGHILWDFTEMANHSQNTFLLEMTLRSFSEE